MISLLRIAEVSYPFAGISSNVINLKLCYNAIVVSACMSLTAELDIELPYSSTTAINICIHGIISGKQKLLSECIIQERLKGTSKLVPCK